jgi:integrase/recombinase XerC
MVTEQFISYLEVEKRYSQHTLIAYKEDLEQFIEFSEITKDSELKEVTHQVVRGWIVQLIESGNTNRTVSRKLSCLRSFFKWLVAEKKIDVNPMLRVKAPKVEKRLPNFVKQSEIEIADHTELFSSDYEGKRDQLIFELFYQTGIRLSELINLKEKDIRDGRIKVLGKRNKERLIPVSADLVRLINEYRLIKPKKGDSEEFFLVKFDGRKLSSKFVYRKINSYLGSVSSVQKKSPHVLRHTFATHLLNNGAGLESLKELLGHASLSATQVYTHSSFAQINSIYSQAHPRGRKK